MAGFSFGSGHLVLRIVGRSSEARTYAGGLHVTVQVDGVDEEHARLKALRVAVNELTDQRWYS